jgi:transposase
MTFIHYLIGQLLPDSTPPKLEQEAVEASSGQITLNPASTQMGAECPVCQQLSHRVHSRYERALRDLN